MPYRFWTNSHPTLGEADKFSARERRWTSIFGLGGPLFMGAHFYVPIKRALQLSRYFCETRDPFSMMTHTCIMSTAVFGDLAASNRR